MYKIQKKFRIRKGRRVTPFFARENSGVHAIPNTMCLTWIIRMESGPGEFEPRRKCKHFSRRANKAFDY